MRAALATAATAISDVWRLTPAVLLALLLAPATFAATAHVQYVSSTSVYLDAGQGAGLAEGATVRVERDGKTIAELQVEFVAQGSAACKVVSSTASIRAGDKVTFEAAAPSTPPPPASSSSAPVATRSGWNTGDLRGATAISYRRTNDDEGRYGNPALRADLRWQAAERRQVALRLRADRPVIERAANDLARSSEPRIYEAALRIRGRQEKLQASAGRFVPERLEIMGYVDGAGLAVRPSAAVQMGIAGGRSAQLGSNGFATEGWAVGGYIEASDARRDGPVRWRLLTGGAHLAGAEVTRRQFGFLRGDERLGPRLRLSQYAEVDVNPNWKRAAGNEMAQLTTAALGAQIAIHRRADLSFGVDRRQDLLMPEQRDLPATLFPLGYTEGANGALHLRFSKWVAMRLGIDLRRRDDGTSTTRAWDGSLYGSIPSWPSLTGVLHGNFYDASPGQGQLLDASFAYRVTRLLRIDSAAGTDSRQMIFGSPLPEERSDWFRIGAGVEGVWGTWFETSAEWRTNPDVRELQVEFGERF